MTLTEKVKALCKERGTTIYALENSTEISSGSVVKWDTCAPTIRSVQIVADFFGLTLNDLMEGVEIPPKKKETA